MRLSDQKEVWASSHLTAKEAVVFSYNISDHCHTFIKDNIPIAVAGVARAKDLKGGVVWLLGTDGIEENGLSITKGIKMLVERYQKEYGYLFNWIHDENKTTQKWLYRLGFTISTPEVWGVDGELFRRIHIGGKNV